MRNVIVERQITAQVELSAAEWQLYDSLPGAEAAADALNRAAELAIAESRNANQALRQLLGAMGDYAKFGAVDSEPIYVASCLMNYVYGNA